MPELSVSPFLKSLVVAYAASWLHFFCALTWWAYGFHLFVELPIGKQRVLQVIDPFMLFTQFPLGTFDFANDFYIFLYSSLVGFLLGLAVAHLYVNRFRLNAAAVAFWMAVAVLVAEFLCAAVMIIHDRSLLFDGPPTIIRGLTFGLLLPLPWVLLSLMVGWYRRPYRAR